MTLRQAAIQALEALEGSRRSHYYCEDTWYSCPQHEGGCANEAEGDECNCGADKANEKIDQAITAIEQALAEPEQKPVAWYCNQGLKRGVSLKQESPEWMPLYTALRAALAEPEQEPVAWADDVGAVIPHSHKLFAPDLCERYTQPLYTAPTTRRPLTDEKIQYVFRTNSVMVDNGNAYMVAGKRAINITRAIEAAHGITGE